MFSGFPALMVWVLAAVLAVRLVNAVAVREIDAGGWLYRRAERPGDYWFEMGTAAAVLLFIVACLLAPPIPGGDGQPIQSIVYLYPAVLLQALARAWRYGRARFCGSDMIRREKPREFWTVVLVEIALVVAIVALIANGLTAAQPRA